MGYYAILNTVIIVNCAICDYILVFQASMPELLSRFVDTVITVQLVMDQQLL